MKLPQTAVLSYKLPMWVLCMWICSMTCWSTARRSGICHS